MRLIDGSGLAVVVLGAVVALIPGGAVAQTGHVLNGVGPANRAMAGAATGNPVDSLGALYWNPAAIGHLGRSEFGFGLELFDADTSLSSRVDGGAFAPGFPSTTLAGSSSSQRGASPIPGIGFVLREEGSRWTCGLGAYGIAGFGVDYAVSGTNPIASPQAPNGLGYGRIYSQYQLMQIAPTLAYAVSEGWSVGFAPVINWASLEMGPFAATAPDDANGDGFGTYPSTSATSAFGIGAQAGAFYDGGDWQFGASLKTPQWFEKFEFNTTNELGAPRAFGFNLDFPMIASLGLGYSGLDDLELALDVRYIDYENTDGFRESGFDNTGTVRGFGWDSIWVLALGVQYRATDTLTLRCGYSFNQNPVPDAISAINVTAPAIIQHHLGVGLSAALSDHCSASLTYTHGFENEIDGPYQSIGGAIPNTSVRNTLSTQSLVFGIESRF